MMVICCAMPLLIILVIGGGGRALGASTWVIFGGIAVMVLAHFFMMGRSHKHFDKKQPIDGENKNKGQSGSGCCH